MKKIIKHVSLILSMFVGCEGLDLDIAESQSESRTEVEELKIVMEYGDVKISEPMMNFFVNDHVTNWYNNYYIYIMYGLIKLDMNKDFKAQKLTASDANYMGDSSLAGKTWYDYFMDTVIENVEMYITYANAAKKANITLTDADKKEIDDWYKAELAKKLISYNMDAIEDIDLVRFNVQ